MLRVQRDPSAVRVLAVLDREAHSADLDPVELLVVRVGPEDLALAVVVQAEDRVRAAKGARRVAEGAVAAEERTISSHR